MPHAILARLAYLLRERPNASELKENANLLKKHLSRTTQPFSDLIGYYARDVNCVELLLLLQALTKNPLNDPKLVETLLVLLSHPLSYPTRNAVVHLIALILCTVIRPVDLIGWLTNQPLPDRTAILAEIPLISACDANLITAWSESVFPLAVSTEILIVIENWIKSVSAGTVVTSGLFRMPRMQSLEMTPFTEQTLIQCCSKPGLEEWVVPIIETLLANGDRRISARLLAEIAPLLSSQRVHGFSLVLQSIIMAIHEYEQDIEIIENVLSFMERVAVHPVCIAELALLTGAYPSAFREIKFAEIGDAFLEIRSGCRGVFRLLKCTYPQLESLLGKALNDRDWRIQESALHAMSSLSKLFPQLSALVRNLVANKRKIDEMVRNAGPCARAILCSMVVCMTAYMHACTMEWLCFVLRILATIDTVDVEFGGWFNFRSKQDNACVVFFELLSRDAMNICDLAIFHDALLTNLPMIKQKLYYRDPFRQSRDIFVKAIVRIMFPTTSTENSLVHSSLFPALCDDCQDVNTYISTCPSSRGLFLPFFKSNIEQFIACNSSGSISLVSIFSDQIDTTSLIALFQLSRSAPNFALKDWLELGQPMCEIHGERFVRILADACVSNTCDFPRYWFTNALSKISDVELQIKWLNRLFHENVHFKLCHEYVESVMRGCHDGIVLLQYTKWLCDQSKEVNAQPVMDALQRLCPRMKPGASPEFNLLIICLQNGEFPKARRIIKKLSWETK